MNQVSTSFFFGTKTSKDSQKAADFLSMYDLLVDTIRYIICAYFHLSIC